MSGPAGTCPKGRHEGARSDDGSAIFLGTAEWFTPNGRQIWHQGIAPDVTVPLPPGQVPLTPTDASGLSPQQLRESGDAQLLRALQEASGGTSGN